MATIKGKWRWEDDFTLPYITLSGFTFISNGNTYNSMKGAEVREGTSGLYYDNTLVSSHTYGVWNGWVDENYSLIDFGDTEQEVSDEFYTCLTTSATQVQEETKPTEYTLRIDGVEVTDYENVIVNGVSYKCKKGASVPTDLTGYTITVPSGWTVIPGYGRFSIIGFANWNGESSINNMQGFGVGVNKSWIDSSTNCAITTNFSSPDNTNTYSRKNSDDILLTITGGNDVTNQSLIQWFVDNGATFTKLITFTIGSAAYHAEPNMTWESWVNSNYNIHGFKVSTNNIVNSSGSGVVNSSNVAVYYTDVIVANATYKVLASGGA